MTREIKFRAWAVYERKWYGEDFSISDSGKILFFENGDSWDVPGEYEVVQFTGLLDKNGNEIYEGDIVRVGEMEDLENDTDATIHKVKWFGDEGYPSFDFEGWGGEVNGMSEVSQGIDYYCEVIGNVYENPELL